MSEGLGLLLNHFCGLGAHVAKEEPSLISLSLAVSDHSKHQRRMYEFPTNL